MLLYNANNSNILGMFNTPMIRVYPQNSHALNFNCIVFHIVNYLAHIFLSEVVGICNTTNHQDATMHNDHAPQHSYFLKMCILSKHILGKTLGQHFQYFML
jgi:hypothetical protein